MIPFKEFEGKYQMDTHIRITKNMLENKTFKSLESNSKVLYLYLKHYAKGNYMVVFDTDLIGSLCMYEPDYRASVEELIDKGFIKMFIDSQENDLPKHFEFTSAWLYTKE